MRSSVRWIVTCPNCKKDIGMSFVVGGGGITKMEKGVGGSPAGGAATDRGGLVILRWLRRRRHRKCLERLFWLERDLGTRRITARWYGIVPPEIEQRIEEEQ